jgi:hypothetical protein
MGGKFRVTVFPESVHRQASGAAPSSSSAPPYLLITCDRFKTLLTPLDVLESGVRDLRLVFVLTLSSSPYIAALRNEPGGSGSGGTQH